MTRIFRTLGIGFVLLAVVFGRSSENTLSGATAADRPNIIFILTDDLDAQSIAFMPKLKALLSDQGVSFSNFFVSFSLCCPSRATILRGQYAHNTQILGNRPPDGGFQKFQFLGEENSTIATWLQAVGYRTMYVGKYLNGYPGGVSLTYVPPGWDEWYSAVKGNAYGEYNYTLNENGKLVAYGSKPEDYGTDVYARKSVDFIRRTVKEGKPFFIHLSVYAPHSPATPAPRHANMFSDAKAPRTANFNEEDVSDKPAYIRNRPSLTSKEIAQIDEQYRLRLQSLQAVDDAIASLVDTLKAVGQLDRTYIFFTSDNGFHLGNHRLAMGKIAPYEEDIRVPLIVRGPGVPTGRVIEHLAGNVDLAPTWADLAGAKAPNFVDGRSLVPLLGNTPPPTDSWRQAFLLENGNLDRRSETDLSTPVTTTDVEESLLEPEDPFPDQPQQRLAIPAYRGIRTKDYLYVEYVTGERELYDLKKDPYQLQNLSAIADPALIKQLSSRLAELRVCAAASCRSVESAPLTDNALLKTDTAAVDINVQRDVTYGVVQGVELKLDIYKPNLPSPLPAIIFVHGGGWVSGNKSWMEPYARYFAKHGYAGFSVNYRLAPQFKFPAQIEDVKCAVRWVRAHAQELNIDPNRIGAMDSSAGGHLVGLLGVTDSSEGLEGACGDLTLSSRVQAIVPYFGPMDLLKLFSNPRGAQTAITLLGTTCETSPEPCKKASPITHVSADDPPFMLVHGTQDPVVPFEQSVLMCDALKAVGVEVELVALEGAGHGWPITSDFGQQALVHVAPFFERHLKGIVEEPLYIVIMTHVEGDKADPEGSPTCASDLRYQTNPLPSLGQLPRGNSFAVDIVGTELLHEILQKYIDSESNKPKLFIEPAGEFWQTEADPRYGNRLFRKYDYLTLGYEFGIQGHGIYYSGQNFCWYQSPKTEEGIRRKLTDLHVFAEKVFHNGQKVNAGLTLTPGAKIEGPAIGRERAEWIYDHVAYELGYRISFEDHDGHLEDEPPGIDNSQASHYLYEADYGDGVRMLKVDFNGSVRADCPGNTPRCETPDEPELRASDKCRITITDQP